ncbi:RHS repeat-associated core domain-containing protein [Chromobacterium subtsugae]|uniref:RHS repeat-associated core domain-containing protein n=1 Tax=Chromobacterium subtsugae TaxID=251747 RepID=UPI00069BD4CC|nr:RHS repeat-associated core domain-containing protein [Chromobacterium subtsugae]
MTTAALARPVAVIPATPQTAAKALQQTGQDFDQWLRSISGGHLTVESLRTIASAVPVVGNLISIGDVVVDIVDMSDKYQDGEEVDLFDWMFLGVDMIGVIPAAGGLFKLGVRPALKLCATSLRQAGKNWLEAEIKGSLALQLAQMLPDNYRATPAKWVEYVEGKIQKELEECASKGSGILSDFSELLISMGSGNFRGYVQKHVRYKPVAYNFNKNNAHGFWATIGDELHALNQAAKNATANAAAGMTVEAASYVDTAVKTSGMGPTLKKLGLKMAKWAGELGAMLQKMLQKYLSKLLDKLKKAFEHHGGAIAAAVSKTTKTAKAKINQLKLEVGTRLKLTAKPSPKCPCAASQHSISYALGEEVLQHTDFSLPGVLPIVWTRQYRSNFDGNDRNGELGARWSIAYATRFDIEGEQLKFHDDSSRTLEYPLLPEGESHKDAIEGFTLTRLSDTLLSQTFGHDLIQLYERHGNSFRLALIKDRAGNSIAMNFRDGRLCQLISSAGYAVDLSHDSIGRITRATLQNLETGLPQRTLAEYRYSDIPQMGGDAGDLLAATDENGQSWSYQYQHHLITRYTDRTGRGITLEWDGSHVDARAIREYADDGSLDMRLAWDKNIDLTYVTDAHGQTTEYYFDEKGYNYRIIYPDRNEEWFNYDQDKKLLSHIHPEGMLDSYEYDAKDNLIQHQRPDGSQVHFAYDEQDNLVEIIDPMGEKWLRAYDDKGQLIEETDPLGHKTKYAYNEQGLPVAITDAKGGAKKIAYRPDGLLESYTDCSGSATQWQYDERGRPLLIVDAMGNATRYQYAANGTLQAIVQPDGQATQLEHDAESRLLKITDPLGRGTHYEYDKAGRLQKRTDANGHSLGYQYDKLGRLTALRNENHRYYRFDYDDGGRLTAETGFDGSATRYVYDNAGRLAQQVEGDVTTDYRYDRAGRLIERSAPNSKESFGYDPAGRLFQAKNRYASLRWVYDTVGNVVEEHHGYHVAGVKETYRWQHEHDKLGNRIATIRPDGHRVDVLNYGSGHVHGLLFGQRDIFNLERDKLHRETQRVLGNALQQTLAYDKAGRLSSQRLMGVTQWSRQYQYDAAGQLVGIADNRSGQLNYRYDPVGRLLEAATPKGVESFRFDPAGNLLDNAPAADGHQDNNLMGNLLSQYAGRHYRYDSRGNLVEKRVNGSLTKLEWDSHNRLSRLIAPDGQRTDYHYDPLGRRIAKISQGQATLYGWDGDVLAFETRDEEAVHYLFEPDSFVPLAQVHTDAIRGVKVPAWSQHNPYDPDKDPLRQPAPEPEAPKAVYYYHTDHLGTPQALTDEQGRLALEMDYKAWGEAREVIADAASKAGIRNPFRFQGQYHDDESGLHYNRHRYYDPEIGRFISRDPIGLMGGINTHNYAPNSIQWVDPLGLWAAGAKYKYKYGPNGEIRSATAKIRPEDLNTGTKTSTSSRAFARSLGCPHDDAGHAIANRLGGSGGDDGVFPQALGINRGQYRTHEAQIAEKVKAGDNVIVRVVPQYDKGSTRPHSVLYQTRINGKTTTRVFDNPLKCCCGEKK